MRVGSVAINTGAADVRWMITHREISWKYPSFILWRRSLTRDGLLICRRNSGLTDSPRQLLIWIFGVVAIVFVRSGILQTLDIGLAIWTLRFGPTSGFPGKFLYLVLHNVEVLSIPPLRLSVVHLTVHDR